MATKKSKPSRKATVSMPKDAEVSIRQIENGFITRQSSYVGGKYVTREVFSKGSPVPKSTMMKFGGKKR